MTNKRIKQLLKSLENSSDQLNTISREIITQFDKEKPPEISSPYKYWRKICIDEGVWTVANGRPIGYQALLLKKGPLQLVGRIAASISALQAPSGRQKKKIQEKPQEQLLEEIRQRWSALDQPHRAQFIQEIAPD